MREFTPGKPEQKDMFPNAKVQQEQAALQVIVEKEKYGHYFEAGVLCEKHGDMNRALTNFESAVLDKRDAARRSYSAAEKNKTKDGAYVLSKYNETTAAYEDAARSAEHGLNILPHTEKAAQEQDLEERWRMAAANMWSKSGDMHVLNLMARLTVLRGRRKRWEGAAASNIFPKERVREEVKKLHEEYISKAITAYNHALEFCDDEEKRAKTEARVAKLEQRQEKLFSH